jgi:hypothetical protein
MYGIKTMIPIKNRCLSPRATHYCPENNEQWLRANLDLLEESWLTTTIKNKVYQHQITRYHNAKVKNKSFKFEDLALWKLEATGNRESKGKLAQKWDGFFIVFKVVKSNIYHLQDMEGKNLHHAWHLDHLKIYHR